jgi:hypothetical protein
MLLWSQITIYPPQEIHYRCFDCPPQALGDFRKMGVKQAQADVQNCECPRGEDDIQQGKPESSAKQAPDRVGEMVELPLAAYYLIHLFYKP